ncbi:MAG TPA: glycosyl transferase family 2 [Cryomorphaceae bacterium]|nr:glycosyl transferase family 2 [Cryomorphaceae bacterium]HCY24873.1 glycosyl transferase family 2 [Cryomorphaceae bacterium]
MLALNKASLFFGGRAIFDEIGFQINPGDRIGLVGRNGAGKSTLLKLIAGDYSLDAGSMSMAKEVRIGFLRQDLKMDMHKTIVQIARSAFEEVERINVRIEEINAEFAVRTDYESDSYGQLISEISDLSERFGMLGGDSLDADVELVLKGLGFVPEVFDQPLNTFSGGWRMRAELARLLLQKPELLLLDEPTNHLDIESIMWLEKHLGESSQTLMVVSHDRTFLDNVTNRTIEVSMGKSYDFNASYSKYVSLRAEIREKQIAAAKNQAKEIKQTEELIERFRAKASKASFAQSLIKKLDKMDRIELDQEDTTSMNFKFQPTPRSGKVVAKAEGVSKSYGDKLVLRGVDLEVERGDRVAFVGQNGQGKSTLVKALLKEITAEGTMELGHNVQVGYFAQDQADELDGDRTTLQTIEDASPEDMRKNARSLLGSFMFRGEDADKKVRVLSGGERGRLALCKLLLQPINFLVMDEPTNHLDMNSKDVLKKSLLGFDGTLLVVSHDREFLEGLVTKTIEFRDHEVKTLLGGIEFYLEQRKLENMREVEAKTAVAKAKKSEAKKVDEDGVSYKDRKQLEKHKRNLTRKLEKVEEEIEDLEAQIKTWDDQLADANGYIELMKDAEFYPKYEQKKAKLEAEMELWEKVNIEKEELEQRYSVS